VSVHHPDLCLLHYYDISSTLVACGRIDDRARLAECATRAMLEYRVVCIGHRECTVEIAAVMQQWTIMCAGNFAVRPVMKRGRVCYRVDDR